jgi:UDP-glucose 4-epimerase
VRQVLDAAAAATGRPVPHGVAPRRPGDPPELVADPRAAFALLGQDLTTRSGLAHIMETAWAWQAAGAVPKGASAI